MEWLKTCIPERVQAAAVGAVAGAAALYMVQSLSADTGEGRFHPCTVAAPGSSGASLDARVVECGFLDAHDTCTARIASLPRAFFGRNLALGCFLYGNATRLMVRIVLKWFQTTG